MRTVSYQRPKRPGSIWVLVTLKDGSTIEGTILNELPFLYPLPNHPYKIQLIGGENPFKTPPTLSVDREGIERIEVLGVVGVP